VSLGVYFLGLTVIPEKKTAEPIQIPFGILTLNCRPKEPCIRWRPLLFKAIILNN